MYLILAAIVLVGLKLLEVGPVAHWSWWWVLSPLVVAFLWFEVFEKMLGFDKRRAEEPEHEKRRRERIAARFEDPKKKRG